MSISIDHIGSVSSYRLDFHRDRCDQILENVIPILIILLSQITGQYFIEYVYFSLPPSFVISISFFQYTRYTSI